MSDSQGDSERAGGGFIAGFCIGAIAGVMLAMLVTPQSGEDTRDLLASKARDVGEKMPLGASELLARGRAIVEAARTRIEGAVSEGREAADRQRDDLDNEA